MFSDITNDNSASVMLGQYLRDHAPEFLKTAEVVVDRYIDPCSFIVALGTLTFHMAPVHIKFIKVASCNCISNRRRFFLASVKIIPRHEKDRSALITKDGRL